MCVAAGIQVVQKTRGGRAVIAFFRTAQDLNAYCQSPYFKKVVHANVLHERLDSKARDYVIRKAATAGQATFSSAVFGRGTDFFCKDNKLAAAGGVHVLQTFFSVDKAEEVQIQGRTARQGQQGTYGLILLQSQLHETFDLGPDALGSVARGKWYCTLDKARASVRARACAKIEKALERATEVDELTHRYFDALLMGTQGYDSAVARFLELHHRLHLGSA